MSCEAEEPVPPLSAELRAELDDRLADYHANPDSGSTWEQVKARLRNKS